MLVEGFVAEDFALIRLSLLGAGYPVPEPPADDSEAAAIEFLAAVDGDPVLRELLAVSSAPLAQALARIAAGESVKPARLRGAVLSTLGYLARARYRSTPFGLLAGVAPISFAGETKVRLGRQHQRRALPDRQWLSALVRGWESDPVVLRTLRVVVNNLCLVRGERLVVPRYRSDNPDDELSEKDLEYSARLSGAVRAVIGAARRPVRYTDLVAKLMSRFEQPDSVGIERMIGHLVARRFLVTDLEPPINAPDPLGHVHQKLAAVPGNTHAEPLGAIRTALHRYPTAPMGQAGAHWQQATDTMRTMRDARSLVQVDLRFDADIVLPATIRHELARAATVAWRLAPAESAPHDPLASYRSAFVETFGAHTLVPIGALLDPQTGLGPPAGYGMPASDRRPPVVGQAPSQRDRLMCELAQRCTARREREVVLDDVLISRLSQRDGGGSYVEACAEVLADSEAALQDGEFRLELASMQFKRPGAMFGRFLPLLPELTDSVSALADKVAGQADSVATQLIYAPPHARVGNVMQVSPFGRKTLRVGLFADLEDAAEIVLDDVLVGVHNDRFYARSQRTGQLLLPLPGHAHNPQVTPNIVRFLCDIGQQWTPDWSVWDWGAAASLTFLPRVRVGRTILSPARWLPDDRLCDPDLDWSCWQRRWTAWQTEWAVPSVVYAVRADNRLRLDLGSVTQLRQLRAELVKHAGTMLVEPPAGGQYGTGWVEGHANQVVVPLWPAEPGPPRSAHRAQWTRTLHAGVADEAVAPGGEWLYAKLYQVATLHDELIACHLPGLLDRVAGWHDRWFFMRYSDQDGAHLRIRFHGSPERLGARLLPQFREWAVALQRGGVIRKFVLDTYLPETDRYGGPAAMRAAERVFDADSSCVAVQLALRAAGTLGLPIELLAAANMLDLASRLDPDGWRNWLLHRYPADEQHREFQRVRRDAVRLLTPQDDWRALRSEPGGAELVASWQDRAVAATEYGGRLYDLFGGVEAEQSGAAFASILHLHYNRLAGIDGRREQRIYAIARGVVQALADRQRHERRQAGK